MAGGRDVSSKAAAQPKGVARRLWRVARTVLFMLRRRVLLLPSGRKLALDLSLLLRRGKIAGKALRSLVSFHGGHHAAALSYSSSYATAGRSSSFSCRELDPALAVHEPTRGRGRGLREVEFSCSNTPSSKRRGGGRNHRDDEAASGGYYYSYDAADIARVFEMLNDGGHLFDDGAQLLEAATPSPALRTPPSARQLRITDSPFAARDEDEQRQAVDMKADEFIRRFYEQLRAQRSAAATPEYYGHHTSSYYTTHGRSPPASLKVVS